MDISKLVDSAINLAKMLSPLMPVLGAGASIAEKVGQIFDDLREEATPDQQEQMQAERKVLIEAVTAKAKAESAALRGEG